jgi:hypothetical protein
MSSTAQTTASTQLSNVLLQELFASLFSPNATQTPSADSNHIMNEIFRNLLAGGSSHDRNNRYTEELVSLLRSYNENINQLIFYNYSPQHIQNYNTNVNIFLELIRGPAAAGGRSRRPVVSQFWTFETNSGGRHQRRPLTAEQIERHVQRVPYNNEHHNEPRCPIAMTPFQQGEIVCLLHCGHYYNNDAFQQYLRRGERICPLCRRDIEETTPPAAPAAPETTPATNDTSTNDTSTNDTSTRTPSTTVPDTFYFEFEM